MGEEAKDTMAWGTKTQEQIKELMDKMIATARPEAIYGAPVKSGEYTVITASEVVASAGFGYGFGSGGMDEPCKCGGHCGEGCKCNCHCEEGCTCECHCKEGCTCKCHREEECTCHEGCDCEGEGTGESATEGQHEGEEAEEKCECECGDECQCECHEQGQKAHGGGGGGGGGGYSTGRPVSVISIGPEGVRVRPVVDITKIGIALFTTATAMWIALAKMSKACRD